MKKGSWIDVIHCEENKKKFALLSKSQGQSKDVE
jgi:hypothetical protein